jgi:NADPH:quinone reductase-like Zn-dependent oxidoreductase
MFVVLSSPLGFKAAGAYRGDPSAIVPGGHHAGSTEIRARRTRDAAREENLELTGGDGAGHAVDYTGDRDTIGLLLSTLGLGGRLLLSSGEQSPDRLPFTAADFIRLELTVLGIRGARTNDARVALSLLARHRIHVPVAARFPLRDAAAAQRLAGRLLRSRRTRRAAAVGAVGSRTRNRFHTQTPS